MNRLFHCILFVLFVLLQCSQAPKVITRGGGDDVTTGTLFYLDGSYAANCRVIAVPSNTVPTASGVLTQFETATDNSGRYCFNALPLDTYNIFGKKDSLASFRKAVVLGDSTGRNTVPNDTLKPSGGIRGIVRFSDSSDSRMLLIQMIGGTLIAWPDDKLGNFALKNLAPGTYRLRFLPLNSTFYILDTAFEVVSTQTTDAGTIVLRKRQSETSDTVEVRDQYINGVWGPNKTYKIMRTVAIPPGDRLEIKEGTHIVFMGNYDFGTDGNCFARGTVDNPILFTYGFNYTGQGWNYLGVYKVGEYFKTLNTDSLVFNNCIFEYCQQPWFEVQTPLPQFYFEMKNCVLRHMQHGLNLQWGGNDSGVFVGNKIIITNNIFHDVKTVDTLSGIEFILPVITFSDYSLPWPCDAPSVQIINNIFYQERWGGMNCHFLHNCYDSTGADSIFHGGDSTCVFDDPKFVDAVHGNYHLQTGSPCIGAGKNGEDMGIIFTHAAGK